jgi:hypothetical protein
MLQHTTETRERREPTYRYLVSSASAPLGSGTACPPPPGSCVSAPSPNNLRSTSAGATAPPCCSLPGTLWENSQKRMRRRREKEEGKEKILRV